MSDTSSERSDRVLKEGKDAFRAKSDGGDDVILIGDHYVGFLDFLGQRSRLGWDFHPTTQPEEERFLTSVKGSFGIIFDWRERIRNWFSAWDVVGKLPPELAKNPPPGYKAFEKSQQFKLGFMQFSDTLISFLPVVNDSGNKPLGGVCSMIYTYAMAMLFGLAAGTPLRGALHIGMVGVFLEGDIYGPALAKAYDIEHTVADYPRVVISNELIEYLKAKRADSEDSLLSRVGCRAAELCLSMVAKDSDGEWIVHYLSETAMLGVGASRDAPILRVRARAFAHTEYARFRKCGERKLAAKYARLLAYFDTYHELATC